MGSDSRSCACPEAGSRTRSRTEAGSAAPTVSRSGRASLGSDVLRRRRTPSSLVPTVDVDRHLDVEDVGHQLAAKRGDLLGDLITFVQRSLPDYGVVDGENHEARPTLLYFAEPDS